MKKRIGAAVAAALFATGCSQGQAPTAGLDRIQHLVVIYEENWSFDALYPHYPNAENIDSPSARPTATQVDRAGRPYTTLPQPLDSTHGFAPDPRFPADLPNAPFDASRFVAADQRTGDIVHRFYQEQLQIDGGRMDRFVAYSDAAGLVMSSYDAQSMPEGQLAQQYTMADHFFHAAFGGSFLNHFWLVCACSPTFPGAPASMKAQVDGTGAMVKDGAVTPDGYVVNTSYSVNTPHPASAKPETLVPEQTAPTIGDRLSAAGVSWAWYSGGWNGAEAGHPDPLFQYHHQPLAYFAGYADGTPGRAQHLKDETDFDAALAAGKLPAVSFVKPIGEDNEHPGYATLAAGQQHVADIVRRIQQSPEWKSTAIVITYDENGGRWDHVPPPTGDRWGPGSRVPTVVISPFARRHYVDHTVYDTTSILATIEHRWGLAPLAARDAKAPDLSPAFDFSQAA